MLTADRLDQLLRSFQDLRIALVGDLFLDRYLYIEPAVKETSIETGLEAYQVTRIQNSPGALGTIVNNLAALGVSKISPFSVIGNDGHAADLLRELVAQDVDIEGVVQCPQRLTPTYTKPLQHRDQLGWCELNRLDICNRAPIAASAYQRLAETLFDRLDEFDGLIVLDQIVESNWGVINEEMRATLRQAQSDRPQMLFFSDSRAHLGEFDFGVLKCNRDELRQAVGGSPSSSLEEIQFAASQLAQRTGKTAYCTLGAEGILVAPTESAPVLAPAVPVSGPIDIVGAGDTASSAIVCALLRGGSDLEAAQLANLAAAVTVSKIGQTGVASPAEITAKLQEQTEID